MSGYRKRNSRVIFVVLVVWVVIRRGRVGGVGGEGIGVGIAGEGEGEGGGIGGGVLGRREVIVGRKEGRGG